MKDIHLCITEFGVLLERQTKIVRDVIRVSI